MFLALTFSTSKWTDNQIYLLIGVPLLITIPFLTVIVYYRRTRRGKKAGYVATEKDDTQETLCRDLSGIKILDSIYKVQ